MFDWSKATRDEQCAEYRRLDDKFETVKRSPLHHDNRCPIHAVLPA